VKETILVIGGCRSGKSCHALEMAEKIAGKKKIFIATCVPNDDEMKQRVARHQKDRGNSWTTVEIPVLVPEAIVENSQKADVILVDCLTLWIHGLTQSLKKAQCPVILVSNEVGTGIVPDNKLARLFRDTAGFVNQNVAEYADRVIWMVAGIPVNIK
jgi:adenosylcobinamide kinase/adenosylcobinamide-phosphate guanylyltransferase